MTTVGVDEVGRGCWAGPLVAGAVVLAQPIPGLTDSKKLSRFQRLQLAKLIDAQAVAIGLGWVTAQEVDSLGLTAAVRLAMQRAMAGITTTYEEIIIDGNYNFLADYPGSRPLIKADDSVPTVSAASIVAKVARDAYMLQLAKKYPGYGFDSHVGYGTAKHLQSLQTYGVTSEHRRSYKPIRAFLTNA